MPKEIRKGGEKKLIKTRPIKEFVGVYMVQTLQNGKRNTTIRCQREIEEERERNETTSDFEVNKNLPREYDQTK